MDLPQAMRGLAEAHNLGATVRGFIQTGQYCNAHVLKWIRSRAKGREPFSPNRVNQNQWACDDEGEDSTQEEIKAIMKSGKGERDLSFRKDGKRAIPVRRPTKEYDEKTLLLQKLHPKGLH